MSATVVRPDGVDVDKVKFAMYRKRYGNMTTTELVMELNRQIALSAASLVRMAFIVSELEKRGEDLSGLRLGLLPILKLIASGDALPDLVVMLSGQPNVLRQAVNLPINVQREIVLGKVKPPASKGGTIAVRKPRSHVVVGKRVVTPKTSPNRPVDDIDDEDIDERIKQLEDEELKTRPTLSSIARSASTQDLADMIVDLIEAHNARHQLANLVVDKLLAKNLLAH